MKIAILDDYQDVVRRLACFALLKDHEVSIFQNRALGLGQLAIRLRRFEVLILNGERSQMSRSLLEKLPNLRLIIQITAASRHVDLAAAQALGVTVIHGEDDPIAVAELTWALIMSASRKIPQYSQHLQEGVWQWSSIHPPMNQLGRSLNGRLLGIWGYGQVGRRVAMFAQAFGMRVSVWGSEESRRRASADGYLACESKQTLFEQADILSLHLRLSEATKASVTLRDLQCMKPDALFVNTSHAALIEENALIRALDQGSPGAAALDVFDTEPLPRDDLLRQRENLLLTPHLGYVELDNYERMYRAAFQKLNAFSDEI